MGSVSTPVEIHLKFITGSPYASCLKAAPEGLEWDERKAEEKLHPGVDFHEAVEVFRDLDSVELLDDREDYGKKRWVVIGATKKANVFTIVQTERRETIRIITTWKSTRAEDAKYHEPDAV